MKNYKCYCDKALESAKAKQMKHIIFGLFWFDSTGMCFKNRAFCQCQINLGLGLGAELKGTSKPNQLLKL